MSLKTRRRTAKGETRAVKYPGTRAAMDGNTAVIMCERESTDAAGAYPITPSTQMGEYWAENTARGHINVSGRPLIFIEPEGEHAAAAVTAGLAMTGLRASNFSSGQGIAYMHESLYAAVGKRLTYVLNIGARAMTKANLNVHAGHDDYHCIDDTGFFQLFAKDAQGAADLNIIAHRIAELSLTPGAIAQDGFLTTHLIESIMVPERALIAEFLGLPEDIIETPTPAQRLIYGDKRRRIPLLWDVDNPVMAGLVQNQDAYMQSVAAQRPFFFDHVRELAERAFHEFYELTGRRYEAVTTYRTDDAEYLIVGQGSLIPTAQVVSDYLRRERGLKVGVVDLTMFRPFPADRVGKILRGRKGVAVLERLDQPLAVDLPLIREIRATIAKCLENGKSSGKSFPELESYTSLDDVSPLYSGSFGMGSRDLQPEGVIGAVENMLPDGKKKRLFYLSIDFIRGKAVTPKQEVYQQAIEASYPEVKDLAVHGSENPNLMPDNAITVRFHSVGGWGAITTGKNLAMTLFDLLGYHIKANPKYGSEKKGQPTTYYLSAAPEPIRVNSEYFYVDVVLSPDPNVFKHTNALAGLKEGGVFIIQSERETAEEIWADIPPAYQKIIIDKKIEVFAIDGFKIAREEATDPELQLRMQGIAFQGAFFAASPVMKQAGLDEPTLLEAIHSQLQDKFGSKGARVVEDNMRVVRRGFDELIKVETGPITQPKASGASVNGEPAIPVMVKSRPKSEVATTDIHRFWEQTGSFYARGMGNDNITDPFIGLGVMPACTALFRDMTGIRFQHPDWIAENCTACGDCYTVCPDTAIPGLVNEVGQVLDTVVKRVKKAGNTVEHLPKAVRLMERTLREAFNAAKETDNVAGLMEEAIEATIETTDLEGEDKAKLQEEFGHFRKALNGFRFALSRPYYTLPEKDGAGGGLLSITVDPYTCKGCMECVEVCNDDALRPVRQTDDSVKRLREEWDFWRELPNTPKKYVRIDDLEEGIGALETLLLDKKNYLSFTSGDGACLGCGEKTVMHLFVATVEALMQPRVARRVAYLDELIQKLEKHIQLKIVGEIDVGDSATMTKILSEMSDQDLTLGDVAQRFEKATGGEPLDQEWLKRLTTLMTKLKDLRWRYQDGTTGNGRSSMGMLNATGCTSVWGSTYPFNPYPFPWANHLFQDPTSMAMGVFEGHMAKMAEGFAAIREVELELAGKYDETKHREFFTYFNWHQFTDDEWELCPPVVAVGGDGAMYDIGFQNLSRVLASGKPIKVLVVDTQVYSNTGGQACTSGFFGQVSDMAQYGKAIQGKQEPRKEIGLVGMAHRTTYVLQSSMSHPSHMIEGFIKGLKARRPALFNLYTPCQPEHGIGDDMSSKQAKLAVESRAYPIFSYDPDSGIKPEDCFELAGNPAPDEDWPTYTLKYRQSGRDQEMKVPMTFADFAMTEVRFRKHFRVAPPDTWNESMVPIAEFLDLDEDEREDKYPFVWSVDKKNHLTRLIVAKPMVESAVDRRNFWTMLRALAGAGKISRDEVATEVRQEVVAKLASGLMQLAGGSGEGVVALAGGNGAQAPAAPGTVTGDYMAPWIDTDECTSCDECTNLNSNIFEYNSEKKAVIKNPDGGPYQDLVKAAEKCTARVIHPGLPKDRSAKDIEKWIKRGEKYNQGRRTMRLLGLKTFRHGVHPPEAKGATSALSVRQFPFAPMLIVPLVQHIGNPSVSLVEEGQEVTRGERIARADGFVSVAMHAPASGVVRRIGLTPSITGRMVPAVFIEPFSGSTQEVAPGTPCDLETATPDEIIEAIQNAGVVGLGGAAFPTHVKLKIPEGEYVDTLIINGVECEPYLTTDHRVMLEQADDVFLGIRYLLKVTGAERVIIGVESNKADAAEHLRANFPADLPGSVELLEVKYPQGAEKMLIAALLDREVPSGGLPLATHALCVNVATTAEIGRLLPHGIGIQERIITISGPAVKQKGNYRIPIGTPLRFLLETVGVEDGVDRVFLGGPMMGQSASSLDISITKGTSGVVAFTTHESERTHRKEYPCIRCGYCVDACPIFLNPSELGLLARNEEYERMADEHNLMDCFECGSCSFVCPSHIPLVQMFRMSKAAVRKARSS